MKDTTEMSVEERLDAIEELFYADDGSTIFQALMGMFQLLRNTLMLVGDASHDLGYTHHKLMYEIGKLVDSTDDNEAPTPDGDNVVPFPRP